MTTPTEIVKPTVVGTAPAVISGTIASLIGKAETVGTHLAGAYSIVRQATKDRYAVDQLLTSAKQSYDEGRAEILRNNAADLKAFGSNEEVREAKIVAMLAPQRDQVLGFTKALSDLDHQLRLANLDLEEGRNQLRVLEVLANLANL